MGGPFLYQPVSRKDKTLGLPHTLFSEAMSLLADLLLHLRLLGISQSLETVTLPISLRYFIGPFLTYDYSIS